MYYGYTEEELHSYCRSCLESLEMWARRLIHEKMVGKYGESYVDAKNENGDYIIKSETRKHIQSMLAKESGRFQRPVDTLFFEHIIYFLCKQDWHQELFKDALDYMYPEGYVELRTFLTRLVPIRNALSHGNPISVRQAEQAVCYSHDFVNSLKKYYKDRGLEQVWNVPRIVRAVDSLGNTFNNPTDSHGSSSIFTISSPLHCGDTYSISVEVDTSFPKSDYDIVWDASESNADEFKNKERFIITFTPKNVATCYIINCQIISKQEWHKHFGHYDCQVGFHLTVLPPLT